MLMLRVMSMSMPMQEVDVAGSMLDIKSKVQD